MGKKPLIIAPSPSILPPRGVLRIPGDARLRGYDRPVILKGQKFEPTIHYILHYDKQGRIVPERTELAFRTDIGHPGLGSLVPIRGWKYAGDFLLKATGKHHLERRAPSGRVNMNMEISEGLLGTFVELFVHTSDKKRLPLETYMWKWSHGSIITPLILGSVGAYAVAWTVAWQLEKRKE